MDTFFNFDLTVTVKFHKVLLFLGTKGKLNNLVKKGKLTVLGSATGQLQYEVSSSDFHKTLHSPLIFIA